MEFQVSASFDDASRRLTPAWFSRTSTNNPAGNFFGGVIYRVGCGMRFVNINIPKGTEILSAHLKLISDIDIIKDDCNTKISAEDVDDAVEFADDAAAFDVRYGNHTTAIVDWNGIPHFVVDEEYTSPDIKDVIQEIVNRGGWASGNAIVLFWEDYGNNSDGDAMRSSVSWDEDPAKAPTLIIEIPALPPPAKPLINKPLVNPILINMPMVRSIVTE